MDFIGKSGYLFIAFEIGAESGPYLWGWISGLGCLILDVGVVPLESPWTDESNAYFKVKN